MNKKQCKDGLDLYKKFLVRMEKVSEFLKVAEVSAGFWFHAMSFLFFLGSCLHAIFTILEGKIRNTCDHQCDMLDRVEVGGGGGQLGKVGGMCAEPVRCQAGSH